MTEARAQPPSARGAAIGPDLRLCTQGAPRRSAATGVWRRLVLKDGQFLVDVLVGLSGSAQLGREPELDRQRVVDAAQSRAGSARCTSARPGSRIACPCSSRAARASSNNASAVSRSPRSNAVQPMLFSRLPRHWRARGSLAAVGELERAPVEARPARPAARRWRACAARRPRETRSPASDAPANAASNRGRASSACPDEFRSRPRSSWVRATSSGSAGRERVEQLESRARIGPAARAHARSESPARSGPHPSQRRQPARNRCSLARGSSKSQSASICAWWARASLRAAETRRRRG